MKSQKFNSAARWLIALSLALVLPAFLLPPASAQQVAPSDTLTITTIERRPFSMASSEGPVGFSIDLWRAVADELGLTYEFVRVEEFSEMLGMVEGGDADAAIANISITSAREEVMDFSQPIFDSGLQVLIRDDGGSGGLLSAILTWEMLGWLAAALGILLAAANLMWLFERRAQEYFRHPYKEGLFRSFWWALNMIVNGGFEERVPQTPLGRIFAVMLVVASLFIVSIFVANITAALTVGELRSQIEGYSDLYSRRVGTTGGSTSAAFLQSQSIRMREYDDLVSLFHALENEEIDAVVHDAPLIAFYAATEGRGRVRSAGPVFRPEKYGIAFPENSALVEPVNQTLLRLRENGAYRALIEKWFGAGYE